MGVIIQKSAKVCKKGTCIWYVCFNSGKIILYLQYKNKRHLMNTYIHVHLHFTVIHEFLEVVCTEF